MAELEELTEAYHAQLLGSSEGMEYHEERGIHPLTIEKFKLGWIAEPLRSTHRGLGGTALAPYISVTGKVVQIRMNWWEDDLAHEYTRGVLERNHPLQVETSLYNVAHAMGGIRTSDVFLVSDVHSVLLLRQEAGARAVAAPGFTDFYEPWYELFSDTTMTVVMTPEEMADSEEFKKKLKFYRISHRFLELPMSMAQALEVGRTLEEVIEEFAGGAP